MSNSLDPDQARHFVGPVLGRNCKDYQQMTLSRLGVNWCQCMSIFFFLFVLPVLKMQMSLVLNLVNPLYTESP